MANIHEELKFIWNLRLHLNPVPMHLSEDQTVRFCLYRILNNLSFVPTVRDDSMESFPKDWKTQTIPVQTTTFKSPIFGTLSFSIESLDTEHGTLYFFKMCVSTNYILNYWYFL